MPDPATHHWFGYRAFAALFPCRSYAFPPTFTNSASTFPHRWTPPRPQPRRSAAAAASSDGGYPESQSATSIFLSKLRPTASRIASTATGARGGGLGIDRAT